MLAEQLGIDVDPEKINCNKSPADRWRDVARWDVDGFRDNDGCRQFVHVCSWDRMGDIIRSGEIAVVDEDPLHFEVCRGG